MVIRVSPESKTYKTVFPGDIVKASLFCIETASICLDLKSRITITFQNQLLLQHQAKSISAMSRIVFPAPFRTEKVQTAQNRQILDIVFFMDYPQGFHHG